MSENKKEEPTKDLTEQAKGVFNKVKNVVNKVGDASVNLIDEEEKEGDGETTKEVKKTARKGFSAIVNAVNEAGDKTLQIGAQGVSKLNDASVKVMKEDENEEKKEGEDDTKEEIKSLARTTIGGLAKVVNTIGDKTIVVGNVAHQEVEGAVFNKETKQEEEDDPDKTIKKITRKSVNLAAKAVKVTIKKTKEVGKAAYNKVNKKEGEEGAAGDKAKKAEGEVTGDSEIDVEGAIKQSTMLGSLWKNISCVASWQKEAGKVKAKLDEDLTPKEGEDKDIKTLDKAEKDADKK